MKKLLFLIITIISLHTYAQIPANYYDTATGTGETLKTQLYNIIKDHYVISYSGLWDLYEISDRDIYYENDNTILDIYSENPTGTDAYEYEFGSDQCGNVSSTEGGCYNREHSFPKSWFNDASPMVSDAFHIYPTDGNVNGLRSNYPYGEVPNPTTTTTNGTKLGSCDSSLGYSGTVFEPIDEFKGDLARTYFYMATRYENEIASWETNNSNGDAVMNGTSYPCYETWFINLLLQWHYQDGVSQKEIDRNNAIYYGDTSKGITGQGNRNPFIDHPEWVALIWDPNPDTEAPSTPTNLIASNITNSSTLLEWDASTDNVGVTAYDVYKNGGFLATTSNISYDVTGLTGNTNYDFYVVAKDAAANISSASNTVSITTLAGPDFLVNEDFNDCSTVADNFTPYDEASDKYWTCTTTYGYDNTGCYQINGYQEDVASKDWLITTNALDFSTYTNEKLSLYLVYTYGTTPLELLYSNDYDGSGNPSDFTWSTVPNVTIDTPTGSTSESTQTITDADISSITGNAYLAFKYYSNGEPTRWNVDNFVISATTNVGFDDFVTANVNLYPNPSNRFISITSDTTIHTIYIYNTLGQKVLNINTNQTALKNIDLSILRTGTYYIRIEFNNSSKVLKFIKN